MNKNLPDHHRVFDIGDDPDISPAFTAGFNINGKYPFQALGPGHRGPFLSRGLVLLVYRCFDLCALTPPGRRGKKRKTPEQNQDRTPAERRASMTWAQRLKRVFNIEIETCSACAGEVRIIACIEDPLVIRKILRYLDDKATAPGLLPPCRAPPALGLLV